MPEDLIPGNQPAPPQDPPAADPAPQDPPPVEDPAPADLPPAAAAQEGGDPGPWQPESWDFKVKDDTYQIPEYLRGSVTSEEQFKEVRDVYERAYGLDGVKTSRDNFKTEVESLRPIAQEYDTVKANLGLLSQHVQQGGDLEAVFNFMGIPTETVLQWVKGRIDEAELPPEQQARLQADRNAAFNNAILQQQLDRKDQQLNSITQQTQAAEIANLGQSLDSELVARVNQKFGHDNAFNDVVRGAMQSMGDGATVAQAMTQVIPKLRNLFPAETAAAPAQAGQPPAPAKPKPVIPNVQGSGKTPLGTPPKDLKDLKARAAQVINS